MDVLTHFRSIEELTKTLSREQGLLSEMFEKRKLMRFPVALAIDLVGGNEARLRKLIDYGVLVEAGNMVEIESDYLNFFEEVLNVNEEISVLSVLFNDELWVANGNSVTKQIFIMKMALSEFVLRKKGIYGILPLFIKNVCL